MKKKTFLLIRAYLMFFFCVGYYSLFASGPLILKLFLVVILWFRWVTELVRQWNLYEKTERYEKEVNS